MKATPASVEEEKVNVKCDRVSPPGCGAAVEEVAESDIEYSERGGMDRLYYVTCPCCGKTVYVPPGRFSSQAQRRIEARLRTAGKLDVSAVGLDC